MFSVVISYGKLRLSKGFGAFSKLCWKTVNYSEIHNRFTMHIRDICWSSINGRMWLSDSLVFFSTVFINTLWHSGMSLDLVEYNQLEHQVCILYHVSLFCLQVYNIKKLYIALFWMFKTEAYQIKTNFISHMCQIQQVSPYSEMLTYEPLTNNAV